MTILVLANKLPYPPRDGGSIATLNMLESMHNCGYRVTCLALNTSKHHHPTEQIPEHFRQRIHFEGVDCNTRLNPLKMLLNLFFSRKPYIATRFHVKAFRQKLVGLLQKNTYDVVQLEGPYLGHYLDTVRQYSQATISFRAHNVEHLIWKRKASGETVHLRRWYLNNMASRIRRYELGVIGKCDCLVAISKTDMQVFKDLGIRLPSLDLPTGLYLETYPFTEFPGEKSIFFIGSLDWMPNQEGLKWFIREVFHKLCEELEGIMFHVAGRNAPSWLISRLQHERIAFHGEIPDARDFMKKYRIMVVPLFTGSGIRIKILESMAMGRPVVTTTTGIEGIPARNGREVLLADDPEMFKDELVTLLTQDAEARDLAEAGRKLIQENFDTFKLSSRLNRFFNEQV